MFNPILILALIGSTQAFFRLPCGSMPLITERVDSIVSPGKVAAHVHSIFGGSNFSQVSTFEGSRSSECSSCAAKADMSNYWTPSLYFQHSNGSFSSVETQDFGVYYLNRTHKTDANKIPVPFPDGLRMLVGNPSLRSYNATNDMAKNIRWNCTGLEESNPNVKNSRDEFKTPTIPSMNCPSGLRGIIVFPSCWNGIDIDSLPSHQAHISYPIGGESGPCPVGFPVRIVTLRFETTYRTHAYNESWANAMNTTQPFVLSNGDGSGLSLHGDFIDGWNKNVLQQVINTCHDANMSRISSCPVLDVYNRTIDGTCRKTPDVNEIVLGTLTTLPGCSPVQFSTPSTPATCPGLVTPSFFTKPSVYRRNIAAPGSEVLVDTPQVVTSYGNYTYTDCFSYEGGSKPFASMLKLNATTMTVNACLDAAFAGKFSYGALANGDQCWAGNSILNATLVGYSGCDRSCKGNQTQICGGGGRTFDLYSTNYTFPITPVSVSSPGPSKMATVVKAPAPAPAKAAPAPAPAPAKAAPAPAPAPAKPKA